MASLFFPPVMNAAARFIGDWGRLLGAEKSSNCRQDSLDC
jgi:hypothetical protein